MFHFYDVLTLLFGIHEHTNDAVYNNAQPCSTNVKLRSSHIWLDIIILWITYNFKFWQNFDTQCMIQLSLSFLSTFTITVKILLKINGIFSVNKKFFFLCATFCLYFWQIFHERCVLCDQTEIHRLCNGAYREFIITESVNWYMAALCKPDDDYWLIAIAYDRVHVQLKWF